MANFTMIPYNNPSLRGVRSRKVLRACARAFPATCPFLSEGAKKESFARRENLYPRLVRQWHGSSSRVEIDERYEERWRDRPVACPIICVSSR